LKPLRDESENLKVSIKAGDQAAITRQKKIDTKMANAHNEYATAVAANTRQIYDATLKLQRAREEMAQIQERVLRQHQDNAGIQRAGKTWHSKSCF
jgi:hypothetical protein